MTALGNLRLAAERTAIRATMTVLLLGRCSGPDETYADPQHPDSIGLDAAHLLDAEQLMPDQGDSEDENPTPCTSNLECESGHCVAAPSGFQCATLCIDTCPDGWSCSLLTNAGGDTTYLCLPNFTYLCRPCLTNGDCGKDAAKAGACVPFSQGAGSFCGTECSSAADCPDGFSCEADTDVEGATRTLCLPTAGACTCNGKAIIDQAQTTCLAFAEGGFCAGTRGCGPGGLSECALPTPDAEVCDGIDEDCDGQTDEGTDVPCAVTNDLGSCTGTAHCLQGVAVCDAATPSPEACDGHDNDCNGTTDLAYVSGPGSALVDVCSPGGPCLVLGAECDDDDPCTYDDVCIGAACQGKSAACLVCDTCDGFGGCKLKPGFCRIEGTCYVPGAIESGNVCHVCAPSSDPSAWTAQADGLACEDGDACTTPGKCVKGTCANGPKPCLPCEDCLPGGACVLAPGWCVIDGACVETGAEKEGSACLACLPWVATDAWTASDLLCLDCEYCGGSGQCELLPGHCRIGPACFPAGATEPGNPCRLCAPEVDPLGWSLQDDGLPCDDGSLCTTNDKCVQGACVPGPKLCPACMVCLSWGGCTMSPGWCLIDDKCYAEGAPKTNNPCLVCKSNVQANMWTSKEGAGCSDGDPCTVGDTCHDGACGGKPLSCEALDDGCHLGVCVGGQCDAVFVGPACDDGNPCTNDACNAATGKCDHTNNDLPCGGGGPCTSVDVCVDGVCVPGASTCPDGFECTALGTCESDDEVFVPAGLFWMGGDKTIGDSFPHDAPMHKVVLSAFAIDRFEVAVAKYYLCINAGGCTAPCVACYPPNNYGVEGREQLPVNNVKWQQAKAYCEWVGKRLPTEAEWEKAARGGCETIEGDCKAGGRLYPWGQEKPTCELTVFNATSIFGEMGCGTGSMAPVGSKPEGSSPYGALDMLGNATEWVSDWFSSDYYCKGPDAACPSFSGCPNCSGKPPYIDTWIDPTGPPTGLEHGIRGGSLITTTSELTVTHRWDPAMQENQYVRGFRCARTIDTAP